MGKMTRMGYDEHGNPLGVDAFGRVSLVSGLNLTVSEELERWRMVAMIAVQHLGGSLTLTFGDIAEFMEHKPNIIMEELRDPAMLIIRVEERQ